MRNPIFKHLLYFILLQKHHRSSTNMTTVFMKKKSDTTWYLLLSTAFVYCYSIHYTSLSLMNLFNEMLCQSCNVSRGWFLKIAPCFPLRFYPLSLQNFICFWRVTVTIWCVAGIWYTNTFPFNLINYTVNGKYFTKKSINHK